MSKQPKKDEKFKEGINEIVKPSVNLPVGMSVEDLMSDAGAGSENVSAENMAIPIICILQGNSPQVKKSDPKYIPGSTEGDLYNNVTNQVYKGEDGIRVVPCFFEKVFIEWRPNRGGFVAAHGADTPLRDQVRMVKNAEGKEVATLPNGNVLTETDQHYVVVLKADGGFEAAVIPMSSTALKVSRTWNTLLNQAHKELGGKQIKPARFFWVYKLLTVGRQKDTYSWSTWAVRADGENLSHYAVAKALYEGVKGGSVRVKQEQGDEAPAVSAEDDIPLDL